MKYVKFAWSFFWGMLAWPLFILIWILYMLAELEFVDFEHFMDNIIGW